MIGEATESWRYGIAVDQKLSRNLYGGAELSQRDLNVPFIDGNDKVIRADWEERLGRAYFYWAPHKWLAASAEYQYEQFRRGKEVGREYMHQLENS